MEKKYEYLKAQYPKYVSVNQLYKICHIAKRTAVYLLDHGIIPYIDTGKTTWKYRIALVDVIKYLQKRDKGKKGVPRGAVNNKRKYYYPRKKKYEVTFASKISDDMAPLLEEYFQRVFENQPDIMMPEDVASILGFTGNTIRRKINNGDLKAIVYSGKYMIPKVHLLQFLSSSSFLSMCSPSDTYKQLLKNFDEWNKINCESNLTYS